jgi:multiple sugar transport system substrate-binding protein
MNIRKMLALVLAAVMICALPAVSTAEAPKLSGKLTIWAWGADLEAEARKEAIEVFIAAHPELQVEYSIIPTADSAWDQKASAALAAGTAPDVIQMSPDYYGMNTDYYMDLRPFVEKDGVDLSTVLVDGMLSGYQDPDGKLEGFPLLANCFCVAYNKDMFDAAGVAYPEAGWTMEGLLDWGKAFVGGEGVNQTYAISRHWVTNSVMAYAGGSTPYSKDLSTSYFDSPEMLKSLQLYQQLVQGGYMPTDAAQQSVDAESLFVSGRAAMYFVGGMHSQTTIEDAEENGINIGFTVMPCGVSDGKEINIQFATGWAITKTSQNPDAAWQFLKESAYANDDMAKATCKSGMTSNKNIAGSYYATMTYGTCGFTNKIYVDHMGATHLFPFGGTLASAGDIWGTMVSAITDDNQDPAATQAEYAPKVAAEFASFKFNSAGGAK